MRKKFLIYSLIGMVVLGYSSCTEDNPLTISKYFQESFPDLDVQTVKDLETPYEAVFAIPSGGRITGDVLLGEIADKLAAVFPGAVFLEAELETERGLAVWEIKLKMEGGGILEVYFVQELGEILKIEGKSGPFNYEVNPGGDFITLSTAIEAAKSFQVGEVVKWELSLEEENRWEYEIHLETVEERFEIEVDAFTGEVIGAKEKDEGDDHETEEHDVEISQDLEDYVHALLAAQIIHVDYETEDLAWDIYVKTDAGAIVEFRISEAPFSIIRIEGEHGPFTYNIEIPDRISFAAAREIALNHLDGEIEEWELDKQGDLWIYEFKISNPNGTYEVEINAVTGEVL